MYYQLQETEVHREHRLVVMLIVVQQQHQHAPQHQAV